MKALKITGVLVLVLAVIVVGLLGYGGMFSKVTVVEKEMGPYSYAYKQFVGPYSKTGKVFDEVSKVIVAAGVKSETGIGVYYDNPAEVDQAKLRSDCGVLVEPTDILKLSKKPELMFASIGRSNFLVVEFPLNNFLSYMIGPMKAYKQISKYMADKKYLPAPGVEIYDMKNGKILYLMQVIPAKQ